MQEYCPWCDGQDPECPWCHYWDEDQEVQFGVVCGRVMRANLGLQEGFEDMRLFGAPSECGQLVVGGYWKEIAQILEEAGMTVEEYNAELEARTSARYAHFSGLELDPFEAARHGIPGAPKPKKWATPQYMAEHPYWH